MSHNASIIEKPLMVRMSRDCGYERPSVLFIYDLFNNAAAKPHSVEYE
jgi:hypothetical protein